jgi:hypothetical protein
MASLHCSDENLYFVLLQLMSHICKYLPSIDMDLVLLDCKRRKEKRQDVVFTGCCHSRHSHQLLLWGKGWGDGREPVPSSETNISKQMDTICKDDFFLFLIFYNFLRQQVYSSRPIVLPGVGLGPSVGHPHGPTLLEPGNDVNVKEMTACYD